MGEYPLKIYATPPANLSLVPGSASLSGLEKVRADELDREYLLRELLEPVRSRFSYILLDCPPNLGLLTLNAYTCANQLVVPVEAQLFSIEGLERALELMNRVKRRLNPDLQVGAIFFARYDRRKILRREVAEELRAKYPEWLMNSIIRESIALSEAPHAAQDIFSYAPASAGALDYQALTAELLTRHAATA